MTEIYTPKQWKSMFGCPSIIIDDKGFIYDAEEYKKRRKNKKNMANIKNSESSFNKREKDIGNKDKSKEINYKNVSRSHRLDRLRT